MELHQDSNYGQYQIRNYQPGQIKVNEQIYTKSLLIAPDFLQTWTPHSIADLREEDFALIAAQRPEVVLLGTGEKQIFPDPRLFRLLTEKNIGVEVMNTGAACRTFNVLTSENRYVVAGLLIR
jgi:uncharacterized protein